MFEFRNTMQNYSGRKKCSIVSSFDQEIDVVIQPSKELQYIDRQASQKFVSLPILKTDYFQNGETDFEHCQQIQKI